MTSASTNVIVSQIPPIIYVGHKRLSIASQLFVQKTKPDPVGSGMQLQSVINDLVSIMTLRPHRFLPHLCFLISFFLFSLSPLMLFKAFSTTEVICKNKLDNVVWFTGCLNPNKIFGLLHTW